MPEQGTCKIKRDYFLEILILVFWQSAVRIRHPSVGKSIDGDLI